MTQTWPSCHEAVEGHDERVGRHVVDSLGVDGPRRKASKDRDIKFVTRSTSGLSHFERSHDVDAGGVEGMGADNARGRERRHLLFLGHLIGALAFWAEF